LVSQQAGVPVAHALPHDPQFAMVERATHDPLQQDVPAPHTFPQVRQLLLSLFVSVHVSPHTVWLLGHAVVQVPPLQVVVPCAMVGHAFVQLPQVAVVAKSAQAPLQQAGMAPVLQTTPHPPQLLTSVFVLAHEAPQFVGVASGQV
jgi:hypothetical protein